MGQIRLWWNDARADFYRATALFWGWRGALFLFAFVGFQLTKMRHPNSNQDWQAFPNFWYLDGYFRWDGGWFNRIIEYGYFLCGEGGEPCRPGTQNNTAFFPLYPYLARMAGWIVGNAFLGGLIVSLVAAWGSTFSFLRLAKRFVSSTTAERAVVLLLVFPGSFFLTTFYTEGLYLWLTLLTMGAFLDDKYARTGIFGCLAMLTRSSSMVLFLAMVATLLWRAWQRERPLQFSMLWLLLMPAGLVIFMAMLWDQVGDPVAFIKAQAAWGRSSGFPLWTPFKALLSLDFSFTSQNDNSAIQLLEVASALFALVGAIFLIRRRKKFPLVLGLYTLGAVLLPLSTASTMSMIRFVAVIFPLYLVAADALDEKPAAERWVVYACTFFLSVLMLRFMNWYWVA